MLARFGVDKVVQANAENLSYMVCDIQIINWVITSVLSKVCSHFPHVWIHSFIVRTDIALVLLSHEVFMVFTKLKING